MKRSFRMMCTLALAFALTIANFLISSAIETKAASSFKTFPGDGLAAVMDTKKVEYIENYLYPSTADSNSFYMFSDEHGVGSFTVDVPSVVKAYYTWDTSDKSLRVSGTSWFSWDVNGEWVLGNKWNLSTPASSSFVFVDPGTYYVNQQFVITSSNSQSGQYIGITILIEPIGSTEKIYESSFKSPNRIEVNKDQYGFLSTNSQNDFFRFTIPEYGKVDIAFYFYAKGGNSVNQGVCTLLNEKQQQVSTYRQGFNTTDYSRNTMSAYLEAGTYYVKLSGCTGPTYLNVGYASYGITVTGAPDGSKIVTEANIQISTGIDAAEVRVAPSAVAEADKGNNTIWQSATDITSAMIFTAPANGDYTVRVKDKSGQYYLKQFTVKGLDRYAPVIEADEVENGAKVEADEKMVVITDDGEITKITLNGSKIDLDEYYDVGLQGYVLNLTEKRKYTIKAYDKAGRNTKFVFTLVEPAEE